MPKSVHTVKDIFKEQSMDSLLSNLQQTLYYIVEISTDVLELFGIIVLVYSGFRAFIKWITKKPRVRLDLAQGIALALEFKLGGEVLRTVVVRQWAELGILGAIIALRAALTFLIHWEIKNEEQALEKLNAEEKKDTA